MKIPKGCSCAEVRSIISQPLMSFQDRVAEAAGQAVGPTVWLLKGNRPAGVILKDGTSADEDTVSRAWQDTVADQTAQQVRIDEQCAGCPGLVRAHVELPCGITTVMLCGQIVVQAVQGPELGV